MFRTIYRKLTVDQKKRGVIYSSAICRRGESEVDTIHEVIPSENPDYLRTIDNLKDVSFFKKMSRDFNIDAVNIVRQ